MDYKADLAYECPNAGPHNPHMWVQGFCAGVEAPEPVLCSGSGLSWVWDKGAAVCQRCHEPATWMGLRPPRRKSGAFTTKVPKHINRMPGIHTFSPKAQLEILRDEVDRLYQAAGYVVAHGKVLPNEGEDVDAFFTALNVLGGSTKS